MCVLICLPQLKRYTKCDKLDPFFSGVFLSKGLFRNNVIRRKIVSQQNSLYQVADDNPFSSDALFMSKTKIADFTAFIRLLSSEMTKNRQKKRITKSRFTQFFV